MFLQNYIWAGCVTLEHLHEVLPTTYWDTPTILGVLHDGVDELMKLAINYVDTIHGSRVNAPKYYRVSSDLLGVTMLCADIYRSDDLDDILFRCKEQFKKWPSNRLLSFGWANPYKDEVRVLADQNASRFYQSPPCSRPADETYSLSPAMCYASWCPEEEAVLSDSFLRYINEENKTSAKSLSEFGVEWVPWKHLIGTVTLGTSWEPFKTPFAIDPCDFAYENVATRMLNYWREIWDSRLGIRQAIWNYENRQQGVSQMDLQ